MCGESVGERPSSGALCLALAVGLSLFTVSASWLYRHANTSEEATRLRNALLFDGGYPVESFQWQPDAVPRSYLTDAPEIPAPLANDFFRLNQGKMMDDWAVVVKITEDLHAVRNHPRPAQADLRGTYAAIAAGSGYCSDFTTVFIALASEAGLFVREWGMSFAWYGGYGHGFVEVFDRQTRQWIFLDVFNDLVARTESGRLMSALELREALLRKDRRVSFTRLVESSNGFRTPMDAYTYYQRAADQWYLWWGNAINTYDTDGILRLARTGGRAVEQGVAIMLGRHPRIRAVRSMENAEQIERVEHLRFKLLAALGTISVSLMSVIWLSTKIVLRRRRRRLGLPSSLE